jgi:hypothetical protein
MGMLMASKKDPVENVEFINLLCRLGVSYHFETEIEDHVDYVHDALPNLLENDDHDLHTVALLFRVLRQYGCKVSSGNDLSILHFFINSIYTWIHVWE